MGVRVREKHPSSGVWWVFVNWCGNRASVRAGGRVQADAVALEVRRMLSIAEAQGFEGDVKAALRTAASVYDPTPTTTPLIRQYALEWLQEGQRLGWKRTTYEVYKSALEVHILPAWGVVPVDGVKRKAVRGWLTNLANTYAPKTVRNLYRVLSAILSSAVEDELIPYNPILHMGRVLPAVRRDKVLARPWEDDQADRLVEAARSLHPEIAVLFEVMFASGARVSEALGLQWGDFDLARQEVLIQRQCVRGRITSTKSRAYRVTRLHGE